MKYKMLVLDLDGTLTNSKKIITKKTKEAITKAALKGTVIVLASGRPSQGVEPLAEELHLKEIGGYILPFNGGIIKDCRTDTIIYKKLLSENIKYQIAKIADKYCINVLTYKNGNIIATGIDQYVALESKINGIKIEIVSDIANEIESDIPKFIFTDHDYRLQVIEPYVKKELSGKANVFRSDPFFLEVVPIGIDKALSLARLLQILGMSKDEIICCGDGFNDISMIEYAGLGVAMENAQQKVKLVANYITLSNDNDGVAEVIEKFILNEDNEKYLSEVLGA